VKYITSALRDISAVDLKNVRDRYMQNSKFYAELQYLYQLIWRIASHEGNEELLHIKQKKPLYVAYTTNRHFYGSLNHDVMRLFLRSTSTDDSCLIIGGTGREIWRTIQKKRKEVRFMSFADDQPTSDETQALLKDLTSYTRVYVCFPHFVSVYDQRADIQDITFRPTKDMLRAYAKEEIPQYFLEPDLPEMFAFFNTQVRYVLFERTLLEAQLSRVAARLVKMDMADHNAADVLKHENIELRRAYNSFFTSRMLETVSGYIQWHKTNI